MNKTILLVEDDKEIRTIQKDYLNVEGFNILEADSGNMAIDVWKNNKIDLIVLDLNLPGISGIEVCKSIRLTDNQTPIIMVTAKTKEIDELLGLEVGADDYVKKPFSPRVLVARIKNHLNKFKSNQERIQIEKLTLDFEKFTLFKDDQELFLTTIQLNMLGLLMMNKGKVFTREEFINQGYDSSLPPDIFDRTVDSHIKNIRKIIEENPKEPNYIITVRSKGYKFNEKLS
jgi:two-component system, OmpR family, alkaline phosphatase synthesis response regulator PhoP